MAKGKTLGEYIEKWHVKKADWQGEHELEVLGVSNVDGITTTSHVKSDDLSGYLVIEPNTFAYNPYRINVGSVGLTPNNVFGVVSPAYIVFKVREGKLIPELLLEFLKSFDGLQQINKYARGTVRKALRFDDLCKIEVNFPDFNEQKNIFEKKLIVEKKSDELQSEIQTQKQILTQLKQSILQDAIQGKLTAAWREQNPDIESADSLLTRIIKYRVKQYETDFNKAKKDGTKKPKKPRGIVPNQDYRFTEHFELPSTWKLTAIDKVGLVCVGSTPDRDNPTYWNGSVNWVSSGEVANNYINQTREKITQDGFNNASVSIYPKGTVLIAMIGQGKTRGQSAILNIEACTNQNITGVIIDHGLVVPEYLWFLFLSRYEKSRSGASGGNQPALNGQKIGQMPIPLPPFAEQKAIVEKVETLMQKCQALEQEIKTSEANAQMLMQAVLKEAFEGKKEVVEI